MDTCSSQRSAVAMGPQQWTVEILSQQQVARQTYRLTFRAPEMAARLVPGQFLMLRLAGWNDPLLGRPLAVYDVAKDTAGRPEVVEVVYLVMGKMTRRLCQLVPGQQLDVWGPLGNGFPQFSDAGRLVMVAGGIGQTPFLALGKETLRRQAYGRPWSAEGSGSVPTVKLLYGARSADLLAGVDDFRTAGIEVSTVTDDGTCGRRGLVTDLLREELAGGGRLSVACCGPEPMLEAVSRLTSAAGVPCWVSLETPMACGIGICFTCVARVLQSDGSWDYRRTCVEGPVFPADRLVWES